MDIRNICLLGHGGSGKTSLVESMLYLTGVTDRLGKTTDGNTVCDYDPEEIKRQISISLAMTPVTYQGTKINVLDTPGNFDFAGEMQSGVRAAEVGVLVCASKDGLSVGAERCWKYLKEQGKPCMVYISKEDEENANFSATLEVLREKLSKSIAPVVVPIWDENKRTVGIIRSAVAYLETTYGVSAEVLLENDWMYTSDAPARLRVAVKSDIPLKKTSAVVSMALATDKGEEIERQSRILSRGGETDTLTFSFNLAPGFYRVRACIELPDNTGADRVIREFNIGCDPEEIISEPDRQPDFDEFWKESLAQLSETAPEYRLTLLPERSNGIRRTYMVDMVSFGGEHISGIYIEPVAEGKYPAFINYMGYGSDVWYNDPSARPEAIEFTLCLRNQALNRAPGEKDDWVVRGLSDKDTYYYRGAFMDVIRAVDFVASREKTDHNRIFAEGGSQGGAQTIVAAALDGRIRAIAPFVPFLSDFRDYFRIASWPAGPVLAEAARLGISDDDLYTTLSYFDIKNFAGRITCPVIMGFGLQDDVCPPHTNFAGYNMIKAPKSYVTFPLAGHHVETEAGWWAARDSFFKKLISPETELSY